MASFSPHIAAASKSFESINKLTYATPLKMLSYPHFTERQPMHRKDVAFWKGQNHIFRKRSPLFQFEFLGFHASKKTK